MQVENKDVHNVTVTVGRANTHSPFLGEHDRLTLSSSVSVAAETTSEWVDVGGVLDTLNHMQWGMGGCLIDGTKSNMSDLCTISVGVKSSPFDHADKSVTTLISDTRLGAPTGPGGRKCTELSEGCESGGLYVDASVRATHRIRQSNDIYEVMRQLKTQGEVHGRPPKHIPIYAGNFFAGDTGNRSSDDGIVFADNFTKLFCGDNATSCLCRDDCAVKCDGRGAKTGACAVEERNKMGYFDTRDFNWEAVANSSNADNIITVSLGGERPHLTSVVSCLLLRSFCDYVVVGLACR